LTWKSHIKFGIKYRGTAGTASRVEAGNQDNIEAEGRFIFND
jgi:hypothetical protein